MLSQLLTVLDAIGGNAQGKRTYGGDGGLASLAVGHYSWYRLDVGPPATVLFPPNRDRNGFHPDSFLRYAPFARPPSGFRIFSVSVPLSTTTLKNGNIISSQVMSP